MVIAVLNWWWLDSTSSERKSNLPLLSPGLLVRQSHYSYSSTGAHRALVDCALGKRVWQIHASRLSLAKSRRRDAFG
jgi:hypothetical protein